MNKKYRIRKLRTEIGRLTKRQRPFRAHVSTHKHSEENSRLVMEELNTIKKTKVRIIRYS
ncbi:hypothetical protein [Paenibacillus sp. YPG26]|uniref:hypothetical protein n=1 Tax=Paenibacillus sp. YPG26 TaxID=2878915 RepID=UPI00203A6398|nr:hypothetical protein [Paenibacillus sp. YPG26]USB31852.1 hypothetical protein LDO05_10865 [Paenibacillus sp. YPG26]